MFLSEIPTAYQPNRQKSNESQVEHFSSWHDSHIQRPNDRHHRGRGVNSTQVRAVDRVLRVHVIVRPLLSHADKIESSIRMQNTHRDSLRMTPLVLVQARASFLNLTR